MLLLLRQQETLYKLLIEGVSLCINTRTLHILVVNGNNNWYFEQLNKFIYDLTESFVII